MKSDTIIISIHPVFVNKLLSGEKQYEYRKRFPKGIRYVLVYATSPVKKITALLVIESILKDSPDNIWNKTSNNSGVTKEFFDTYFNNKAVAYAIRIKKVYKFKEPLLISDLKGINAAPQSYIYLKESIINIINQYL